jgi:hypothetical protein
MLVCRDWDLLSEDQPETRNFCKSARPNAAARNEQPFLREQFAAPELMLSSSDIDSPSDR